jgi:hypothetical protein
LGFFRVSFFARILRFSFFWMLGFGVFSSVVLEFWGFGVPPASMNFAPHKFPNPSSVRTLEVISLEGWQEVTIRDICVASSGVLHQALKEVNRPE